jgi:hypothetical protein
MEINNSERQYEKPIITTYAEKDYRDLVGPVCTGVSFAKNTLLPSAYPLENRFSVLHPVNHSGLIIPVPNLNAFPVTLGLCFKKWSCCYNYLNMLYDL